MNALVDNAPAVVSGGRDTPSVQETTGLPDERGTHTASLSSELEQFLRDRFSTKLEDPLTWRWIRSWRNDGI